MLGIFLSEDMLLPIMVTPGRLEILISLLIVKKIMPAFYSGRLSLLDFQN
jgi:hypothetical protein